MEIRNEGCRGEDLTSTTNKSQRSQQWEEQYTKDWKDRPLHPFGVGETARPLDCYC